MGVGPRIRRLDLLCRQSYRWPIHLALVSRHDNFTASCSLKRRENPVAYEMIRGIMLEVVCCSRLTHFSCNLPVNRRALLHLARMPALRRATLDVSDYDEVALSLSRTTFPALRSLELTNMTQISTLDALSSW